MTSKRFTYSWTSEDYIQYRLYIIPSDADYSSGSTDQVLPSDFLLEEGKIETSIGELPAGMQSQVLSIAVNIASLQGTSELNNLREQLLKGTTTKLTPKNSDGSEYLDVSDLGNHSALTTEQKEFEVFNTFVLLYNDGFGFTPNVWKVAFLGCQKYAAENELEVTDLENVLKFTIEAHDITRCIGEMITPEVWKIALRSRDQQINLTASTQRSETEEYREVLIGTEYYYQQQYERQLNAVDWLTNRFFFHVSTFDRLGLKISQMYSAYLRAITRKNSASFSFPQLYEKTIAFKDQDGSQFIGQEYLCYIAEIWEVANSTVSLVSGAHADSNMFGQFTNFHEVLKSLCENSLELFIPSIAWTNGNPDTYAITYQSSNPFGITDANTIEMNQENTFSSYKMKMFSESLRYATLSVTSIGGDRDTTEYRFGDKGTSGDNSKEMKIMFHNLPVLQDRKYIERYYGVWDNQNLSWIRKSVSPGYIIYFKDDTPHLPRKVYTQCYIYFDADAGVLSSYTLQYPIIPYLKPDGEMFMIREQQDSGLPTTIAYAMVQAFGDKKQAESTMTSRFINVKQNDIGKRCKINIADFNPLLEKIYNANIVKGVFMESSHDILKGTTDLTIRIDAEQ